VRCEGLPFELPCEAAAGRQPPSRATRDPARQGAAHFALLRISVGAHSTSAPPAVGTAASDFRFEARIKDRRCSWAQSAGPQSVSASRPSGARRERQCSAGCLPPYAAPLLGRSVSLLLFLRRLRQKSKAPPLLGKPTACLSRAAIPPHLCREESRQKCSGQPRGRRPACWRRQCQFVPRQSRSPNCHRLRRWDSARPVGQEPSTFVPAVGRPGPGPGGRLPTHTVGLFRCSREPVVSLPRRSRARRPFPFQTASGATLHFVPRPMALADSQPPHKAPATTFASVRLPAP